MPTFYHGIQEFGLQIDIILRSSWRAKTTLVVVSNYVSNFKVLKFIASSCCDKDISFLTTLREFSLVIYMEMCLVLAK